MSTSSKVTGPTLAASLSRQEQMEFMASQEAINAYDRACDGLRAAISYAKTWTPPAGKVPGCWPVADFAKRARELAEIAENWSAE